MVERPRPGVKYTAAQFDEMRRAYPDLVIPGHVLRIDAEGTFSIVPWQEAAYGGSYDPQRPEEDLPLKTYALGWDEDPFPVDPIRKRTPQERTNSMMTRLVGDWRKTGGIPGLSEEKVRELVGRSWKRGNPLSAAEVRRAAASLLQDAEAKYEASERKKVVRTSPTD